MEVKARISDKEIGRRLSAARKRAGLLQKDAADHFKANRNYIGMIERGERGGNKDIDLLMDFADLYQVNIEFLIGLSNEMSSEEFIYTPLDDVPAIDKDTLDLADRLMLGNIYFQGKLLNPDQLEEIYIFIEKLIEKKGE